MSTETKQTFLYGERAKGRHVSVVAQNISVLYHARSSDPEKLASASFSQKLKGKLLGRDPLVDVEAVKNVSLITYQGDSVGFLGINGAGKSTLLRIISGGETPAAGRVFASAQPQMLGVSAALMPELSGYENARLGCLAIGMTPEETDAALPEIIDFTSIGNAIYRPMKSYSSGMGARLRFAISTAANPEIMIIDEALSTGDATFQQKSKERMDEMLAQTGTILLVSHSADQVSQMCNRAVWMHHGEMVADGTVEEVTDFYRVWAKYLRSDKTKAQEYLEDVQSEYHKIQINITGEDALKHVTAREL